MKRSDIERFVSSVRKLILNRGGIEVESFSLDGQSTGYNFNFPSRFGAMTISVTPNKPGRGGIGGPGQVFTRFDDPEWAIAGDIDCNSYSGKWNHHYFGDWTADCAIADVEFWLDEVCVQPTRAAELRGLVTV